MSDKGIKGWVKEDGKGRSVRIKAVPSGDNDGLYKLVVESNVTLKGGDLQIGAVEIKNHDTDDRAFVDTAHFLAVKDQLDDKYQPVTLITIDANKIDLALVGITEAHKVSFIVSGGDCHLAFDKDASASEIPLKNGQGYSDDKIKFTSKISIIRDAGVNVTLYGVIWGI